jgi:hypothetical protein
VEEAMQAGDLVRHRLNNYTGIVVEQQRDAGDGLGMYWLVLLDGKTIYVREADMEVISARV